MKGKTWTTLDVIWALLALMGGIFLVQSLQISGAAGISVAVWNTIYLAAVYLFLLIVVIVFTVVKYGSTLADLGFRRFRFLKTLGLVVVWWLAVRAVILLYSFITTTVASGFGVKPPSDLTNRVPEVFGPGVMGFLLAFVIAVIIGPVIEEVFFRGFLYPAFKRRLGVVAGVIISSFIFGLFHVNPWLVFPTAIMGAAMALLYEKEDSLWAPILFHSLNNLVSVVLVYTLLVR